MGASVISSFFGPTSLLGSLGAFGKSGSNAALVDPMFNLGKTVKGVTSGKTSFMDALGDLDPIILGPEMANIDAANAAKQAQIQNDLVQTRISASNKSIQLNNQLIQTLGLATVQASSRGISEGSPAFKAVNEESIQTGLTQGRFDSLTESLQEQKLQAESEEATREAEAQKYGAVFDVAKMVGTVFAML